MSVNQFADMSQEEFMQPLKVKLPNLLKKNDKPVHEHSKSHYELHVKKNGVPNVQSKLPVYKNWFEDGAVSLPYD
jgi:hypothetical protein